jgi:hypothetical protein
VIDEACPREEDLDLGPRRLARAVENDEERISLDILGERV